MDIVNDLSLNIVQIVLVGPVKVKYEITRKKQNH